MPSSFHSHLGIWVTQETTTNCTQFPYTQCKKQMHSKNPTFCVYLHRSSFLHAQRSFPLWKWNVCLETNGLGNQAGNICFSKLLICSKKLALIFEWITADRTDNSLPFLSPSIYIKIKLTSNFSMHFCLHLNYTTSKYDPFLEYVPPVPDSEHCMIV